MGAETPELETQTAGLLADVAARATRYLDEIGERRVAPTAEQVSNLDALDTPLPGGPCDPRDVLAQLDDIGSPATVASAGPRYFGFVTGGAHPAALAAAWLTAAWDQNAAMAISSPVSARLDAVALRWIVELLGLPPQTGGGFVTGATMANATCLAAARDAVLTREGWDAAGQGLVGAPPVSVIVGEEVHATVFKALGLVGLGRGRARSLPVDDQGRIVARDLPQVDGPTIVCLQAGNVNSGASDPFEPLIEWAHEANAWVHVDGAFGLWAAASPSLSEAVRGLHAADSWATDAHKWLNTTYDCGVALVREPDALRESMRASAAYLPTGDGRSPMDFTPQSSQRARGVECWALLRTLGRDGVADLIERCCRLARRFADGLSAAGGEVHNDVVLNQCVVSFGERTGEVIAAVQADGTCWAGETVWRGRRAMRISVSSWATTDADIDRSLAAIVAIVKNVEL